MDYEAQGRNGAAIQKAIDAAGAAGGGRVVLPPGEYSCGTLWLRSNVELHLAAGARLVGAPDAAAYDDFVDPRLGALQPEGSRKCLLAARDAENIAVTGEGEINGSGPEFYDRTVTVGNFYRKPATPRPRMIQFFRCRRIRLEGVTLCDSPGWTIWLAECASVVIRHLQVQGDPKMINNDGLDLDGCTDVVVSDCVFRTGDDCIALRAMRHDGSHPVTCENILVTHCVLESACQGIRVGCPSDDTICHCRFTDLVIRGSGNGVNINNPRRYLAEGCHGYLDLHDVEFSRLTIAVARVPVWVHVEAGVRLRAIHNLRFDDLSIAAPEPCRIEGCAETVPEAITFRNLRFQTADPGAELWQAHHCRKLRLENVLLE